MVVATKHERPYGGQERAERIAERRQKLIETGIRLFGTEGYHATTVRALITESGLASRYFYESFANPEDLLVACYDHLQVRHRARLTEALMAGPASLGEKLKAGIRCYFEALRDPHFARITQLEVLGVSDRVTRMFCVAMDDMGALLMATLKVNLGDKAKGNLPPADRAILGSTLVGALSIAGTRWTVAGYQPSIERMVELSLVMVRGTLERMTGQRID